MQAKKPGCGGLGQGQNTAGCDEEGHGTTGAREKDQDKKMRGGERSLESTSYFSSLLSSVRVKSLRGKKGEDGNQCRLLVLEWVTVHSSCHQDTYHR